MRVRFRVSLSESQIQSDSLSESQIQGESLSESLSESQIQSR